MGLANFQKVMGRALEQQHTKEEQRVARELAAPSSGGRGQAQGLAMLAAGEKHVGDHNVKGEDNIGM